MALGLIRFFPWISLIIKIILYAAIAHFIYTKRAFFAKIHLFFWGKMNMVAYSFDFTFLAFSEHDSPYSSDIIGYVSK